MLILRFLYFIIFCKSNLNNKVPCNCLSINPIPNYLMNITIDSWGAMDCFRYQGTLQWYSSTNFSESCFRLEGVGKRKRVIGIQGMLAIIYCSSSICECTCCEIYVRKGTLGLCLLLGIFHSRCCTSQFSVYWLPFRTSSQASRSLLAKWFWRTVRLHPLTKDLSILFVYYFCRQLAKTVRLANLWISCC